MIKLGHLLNSIFNSDTHTESISCSPEQAVCVLLIEIMRADDVQSDSETQKIKQLLQQKFELTPDEIENIITLAHQESDTATDFYRFTRIINDNFSIEEKITIVTQLWLVALADGTIDAIEEHIIRRIADLLHLRHNEYIQAKTTAANSHH